MGRLPPSYQYSVMAFFFWSEYKLFLATEEIHRAVGPKPELTQPTTVVRTHQSS